MAANGGLRHAGGFLPTVSHGRFRKKTIPDATYGGGWIISTYEDKRGMLKTRKQSKPNVLNLFL